MPDIRKQVHEFLGKMNRKISYPVYVDGDFLWVRGYFFIGTSGRIIT